MTTPLATELQELLSVDATQLSHREHVAHMRKLERAHARLEAHRLRSLAAFEASTAFQVDAARDPVNWLTGQVGTSRREARGRVNLARHLQSMPYTMCALSDGKITEAHARILARCVRNPRTSGQFAWDEPYLVGQAKKLSADDLEQLIRQWIEMHDADGSAPPDPQDDVLHASQVGERVKIDGDLGLDVGLPLLKALDERCDQLFRRDRAVSEANPLDGLATRTPGNRRAEALVELVMAGAGAESNPRRRDPLFSVFIDPKTFATSRDDGDRRGRPNSARHLADGTVIPLPVLLNWRCEAQVSRSFLDARGAMLSYGRDERYANRELRRALEVRDRGCAIPGCDRPPEHCDAHHVIFWEEFGPTDIENLVLLCRHHHRTVHAGRVRIEMHDGVPVFYDAVGARLRAKGNGPPHAFAA